MAYVITSACIGTQDQSCVDVCPVDCFYSHLNPELNKKYKKGLAKGDRPGMLVINPDECINCGACETECPVEAIYEDTGVPEDQREFIKINEEAVIGLSDSDLDQRRVTSKS